MASRVALKTRRMTACAVLCGLNVVVMYFGSMIEVLDLTAAFAASLACIFAVIEIGGAYPWLTYAVTGALGLVLLPFPKTVAMIYVLFTGYYPILKAHIERLSRPVAWVVKLAVFNVALTALVVLSTRVLNIPESLFEAGVLVYVVGNVTFVLYDMALTSLITFYLFRLRKKLKLRLK